MKKLLFVLSIFAVSALSAVDNSTMHNKVFCGYQGWFRAEGDGSNFNRWLHYFRDGKPATADHLTVEMWPDMREYDEDELYPTKMKMKDGTVAKLYSANNPKTVMRHVKWMQEYNIDGFFAQRFVHRLEGDEPALAKDMKGILTSLKKGAVKYDRIYGVMYDVSGATEGLFWESLKKDWMMLVDEGLAANDNYINHNGKPVVAIYGMGSSVNSRPPNDPEKAMEIINWFKNDCPPKYRATLLAGVPSRWRTMGVDCKDDDRWAEVYRSYDIMLPWTVGRFRTPEGSDYWRRTIAEDDIKEIERTGQDYLPVVFPGFAWHNLLGDVKNKIPREGGKFLWRQAYNMKKAGAKMLYIAMFDEIDEATCIYKTTENSTQVPADGYWLSLDADGYDLPSDWYLQVSDKITQMYKGEIPTTRKMPLDLPIKRDDSLWSIF